MVLKSLNISELEKIALEISQWAGFQVQSVSGGTQEIGLKLHGKREDGEAENLFLWADLAARTPLVLLFEKSFPKHSKKLKPIHLFLKSNLEGGHLKKAYIEREKGRVLFLEFEKVGELVLVEIRLFPHGRNMTVSAEGKSVSWTKPSDLPASSFSGEEIKSEFSLKDWLELSEAWRDLRKKPKQGEGHQDTQELLRRLKNDLKKKKRALEKVGQALTKKKNERWFELGQWLQTFGVSDFPQNLPLDWQEDVDLEKSLSWNIQNSFQKAKKEKEKTQGRLDQKNRLQSEIEELEQKLENPEKVVFAKKKQPQQKSLLAQAKVRGRTKELGDGVEALLGRSAQENLGLLRRAKPWFLWLHIKDEPGAHLIISMPKNHKISDQKLKEAYFWLCKESQKGMKAMKGPIEVVVAECRFVRPIKGDRLGRVNYSNEKVLRWSLL